MITIPCIIKESSEGFCRHTIQDEMFQNREIECVGEISQESVYGLILQLRYLQRVDPEQEITMYINSPGGEISSGLALYDTMQAVKCPVRTVCTGMAASMAALLFASGNRRDMLPHARIMIHHPLMSGGVGGTALRVDALARDLMKMRETVAMIFSAHCGLALEEVCAQTATDTCFDAREAIAWGLADRIITEL